MPDIDVIHPKWSKTVLDYTHEVTVFRSLEDIIGMLSLSRVFDLGSNLEYESESFATLIGKLEFGSIAEGKAKIKKLMVNEEYRNQGFATYMMKKVIAWGRSQDFSELYLTACTSVYKLGNALNQDELVSFYHKLGFENISPKSNRMTYKYCDSGVET